MYFYSFGDKTQLHVVTVGNFTWSNIYFAFVHLYVSGSWQVHISQRNSKILEVYFD